MTQPIEAAALNAGQHHGRLATVHSALADGGRMLSFAFTTMETLAASKHLGPLAEAVIDAENAGVPAEVFTAVTDMLRAAAARSAHPEVTT